ncbi:hypothetical protein M569_01538 [Genlisea aurea]|uniref:Conserved oligomeric Golgi complex subunit 1 n=1 Tax=Genlisea aurea TaxID=192259 RepID=S8EKS4_9LAMI|nr:hypothetical protein M569_01538 [Genlisea aurea]
MSAAAVNPSRHSTGGVPWNQDAESLFRLKSVSEIRKIEAETRRQIQGKSEELRQLVGNGYRDLIDSADSIIRMDSTCRSISANISSIHHAILYSIASPEVPWSPRVNPDMVGARSYGIACRVKYLVDTPENIWGRLDESMFLESSARYIRAKYVHHNLLTCGDNKNTLANFPLLQHQWQIVESFKIQISQRSRERLLDHSTDLGITAYADALAAIAIIDELDPKQVLAIFIDSRRSIMSQKLNACFRDVRAGASEVISVFCEVLKIIQITVCQVGELFLRVLNDMPLFYRTVLDTPPASQLFGGIPNPDEEIKLWNLFKGKLDSDMILLDRDFISKTCSEWLKNCGKSIMSPVHGRYLIDVVGSGFDLCLAEKSIRETMENKQVLEGSLEWLKSVFGSEIEWPWKRTRELVLGDDSDLWDDIFEDAFTQRMKGIVESQFKELSSVVDVVQSVRSITKPLGEHSGHHHFRRSRSSVGVWFTKQDGKRFSSTPRLRSQQPPENDLHSYLSSYFGPEVSQIKDAVDRCCRTVLEDLLGFLDSPNAQNRLKDLAPFVQDKCYRSLSGILTQLKQELDSLYAEVHRGENRGDDAPELSPSIIVERSIFIGRLLFAFQKHAKHIFVILGSPRSWMSENSSCVGPPSPSGFMLGATNLQVSMSPRKKMMDKQISLVSSALFGMDDSLSPKLEELRHRIQELSAGAYGLWILCVCDELSVMFSRNLRRDDALSATSPVRGWEETVIEHHDQSEADIKISLPSIPSLHVASTLFYACEEIHHVGGHVLDRNTLQNFASKLFDKVLGIYEDFVSSDEARGSLISEKGCLQILFDLKLLADTLSAGSDHTDEGRSPFTRKIKTQKPVSIAEEQKDALFGRLSRRLDPIDWLTYEPYLWENVKQAYLRHTVLHGFFVQLGRIHSKTSQKLPTNSESNIMHCSTVPRFKYLPFSAPALSARSVAARNPPPPSYDDVYFSRSGSSEIVTTEEAASLGVAAPLLKSFMQVYAGQFGWSG